MDIKFLGHESKTGKNQVLINDFRFEFKLTPKGAASFKDLDGMFPEKKGKVVARTYRSFRTLLGIQPGSPLANSLVTCTSCARIHYPWMFSN